MITGDHPEPANDNAAPRSRLKGLALAGYAALNVAGILFPASIAMAQAPPTSISVSTDTSKTQAGDSVHVSTATTTPPPASAGVQQSTGTANTDGFHIAGANQVGGPAIVQKAQIPLHVPATANRAELNGVIEQVAEQHGVPPEILKAVAWQETGWMHYAHGKIAININRDKDGGVVSTDYGILQINDKAHKHAFPKAMDCRGNLDYGAKLLKDLYEENGHDWSRAIWHYNGDRDYVRLVQRHMEIKPWTVQIHRDNLQEARHAQKTLPASITKDTQRLKVLNTEVQHQQQSTDRLEARVHAAGPAATHHKKGETSLQAQFTHAQGRLQKLQQDRDAVQTRLDADRTRLEGLPQEIQNLQDQIKADLADMQSAKDLSDQKDLPVLVDRVGTARVDLSESRTALTRDMVALKTRHLVAAHADLMKQLTDEIVRVDASLTTTRKLMHRLEGAGSINVPGMYNNVKDLETQSRTLRGEQADLHKQVLAVRIAAMQAKLAPHAATHP